MAGQYPFSDIKDHLPFGSYFADMLEGGSKITRARSPLWKLSHRTGGDQQELCCKESDVVTYIQEEEHYCCLHPGYLCNSWKKRGRSSTQNVMNLLEESVEESYLSI